MIFENYLKNIIAPYSVSNNTTESISIYPISEENLEGIKILIDNCIKAGSDSNKNVVMATINPSVWLGNFLDNYWQNISYVTTKPKFDLIKIEENNLVSKAYSVQTIQFKEESEIQEFFNNGRWKRFVLYSIIKYADLENLTSFYSMRFADITEKYEERNNKLKAILE